MHHLAVAAFWIGIFGADPRMPGVGPDRIRLEAYVDRAPENASIVREIRVQDEDERSRKLFVVSALRPGGPESAQYFDIFPRKQDVEVELFGSDDQVASIIEAPAGTKVIASVVPYGHDRRLLVGHVSVEQPSAPTSP